MNEIYRVLYIDDEEMLLELGKIYLERTESFQVLVTTSAQEVLESLHSGRYDAIISDYEMPKMNGIELLKAVRNVDPTFPFILFTGRGREDVAIEALNNGANFYIQKGGDPKAQFAELAHKVRQAVLFNRTEQSLNNSIHELSQAKSRYEALIIASHTGAWEYHADTGYLWCSPEYFSMLGRDVREYDRTGALNIDKAWTDLLHPDDRNKARAQFEAYLNQPDGMYEQQFRMLHADCHSVWIWSRGRTLFDENKNPTSITVGTHIDITERKQQEENLQRSHEELKAAYDVIARTGEELRANLEKLTIQEQALRESEEMFRTFFESAGDAIIIQDNGVICDCNHQAELLFRVPKSVLLGKIPSDFAPALQPSGVSSREMAAEKRRLSQNGLPQTFEYVLRHPDGTEFFTEVTLQQIRMQGRWFQQAIVRDITVRKQAEMELIKKNEELATAYEEILSAEAAARENEQLLITKDLDLQQAKNQLDDIISLLPDATFVINGDGVVIAWNRAMEELTGISADQILGKGNFEYALPFYRVRRPLLIDYALVQDPDIIRNYNILHKYDSSLSAEVTIPDFRERKLASFWVTASPLFDIHGTVTGAIESLRDISRQVETRELLQKSEERYRLTLDASNEGIWDVNLKTGSAFFSPHWYSMLGYEPGELPAMYSTWQELLHPDDARRTIQFVNEHIHQLEGRFSIEFRMRTKDGGWRWIMGKGQVVERDQDGTPVRMLGTHTDITKLKRVEEHLRLNERRLETLLTATRMVQEPVSDILNYALENAVRLTNSRFGYVAFVHDDETRLTMYAWTQNIMAACAVGSKPKEYLVSNTGLWGEPVRSHRPVITNNYETENALKRGLPDGHVSMTRHLGVPILDGSDVVMVVGVANKEREYEQEDVYQIDLLMSGVWNILQRKKVQEELLHTHEELTATYEELAATEEELRAQYELTTSQMVEIQKNERLYRSVFSSSLFGMAITAPDGRWVYFNEALCTMLGYQADELSEKTWKDLTPPEDLNGEMQIFANVLTGADPKPLKKRYNRKDGQQIIVLLSTTVMRKEDGSIDYLSSIILDVTPDKNLKFDE